MKADTQQPAQAEEQPQAKTLVLKYIAARPRGLIDVSHQYMPVLKNGLEAYCKSNDYQKLMDICEGVVELYDRKQASTAEFARYLIVAYVRNPGEPQYTIIITVESDEQLYQLVREDNILRSGPLLPKLLYRLHGIQV